MDKIELTLCRSCASIYYNMSDRYIKRKDYEQTIKECCDICRVHMGFDYVISNKLNQP